MSSAGCTANGSSCADGNGICVWLDSSSDSAPTLACECLNPDYEDLGDLRQSSNCSVYIPAFNALWALVFILFAIDIVLGFIAIVMMQRKKESTRRNELFNNLCFLVVSLFAVTLALLELTPFSNQGHHHRRIGVDLTTSIIFAFTNFSSYSSQLTRPILKSETSIARFVLERSNRKLLGAYKRIAAVAAVLFFITSILPVISAVIPEVDRETAAAYGFVQAIATGVFSLGIAAMATSVTRDFTRALTHPAVSSRNSLRSRVQAFTRHAQRTMFSAFLVLLGIALSSLAIGSCEDCARKTAWIILPTFSACQGFLVARTFLISIQTSRRYRTLRASQRSSLLVARGGQAYQQGRGRKFHNDPDVSSREADDEDDEDDDDHRRSRRLNRRTAERRTQTGELTMSYDLQHQPQQHLRRSSSSFSGNFSSPNQPAQSSPSSPLGSLSSSSPSNINATSGFTLFTSKRSAGYRRGGRNRVHHRLRGLFKNMSAVPEVDYEGTVIMTNVEQDALPALPSPTGNASVKKPSSCASSPPSSYSKPRSRVVGKQTTNDDDNTEGDGEGTFTCKNPAFSLSPIPSSSVSSASTLLTAVSSSLSMTSPLLPDTILGPSDSIDRQSSVLSSSSSRLEAVASIDV